MTIGINKQKLSPIIITSVIVSLIYWIAFFGFFGYRYQSGQVDGYWKEVSSRWFDFKNDKLGENWTNPNDSEILVIENQKGKYYKEDDDGNYIPAGSLDRQLNFHWYSRTMTTSFPINKLKKRFSNDSHVDDERLQEYNNSLMVADNNREIFYEQSSNKLTISYYTADGQLIYQLGFKKIDEKNVHLKDKGD